MGEMSMDSQTPPANENPAESGHWARPIDRLKVSDVPTGATAINVNGREVVSPMQGFGPLWQKTYRVRLAGAAVSPQEVMREWKAHFPEFQPPENRFLPSMAGVKPGEVLFIEASLPAWPGSPWGFPVSAGVMVLYADDEMFTVMTPAGFPEAGWNTFSAFVEDGVTVAQVQSLARSNDPIYEFGFRYIGGAAQQEKIWAAVLTAVAAHFGVKGTVQTELSCIDNTLQWSQAKNVWQNAIIRTFFYNLAAPWRWLTGRSRR
jgi:hypothetical protein